TTSSPPRSTWPRRCPPGRGSTSPRTAPARSPRASRAARTARRWPARWAAGALAAEVLAGAESAEPADSIVAWRGAERWVLAPADVAASDGELPDRDAPVLMIDALTT